jgi:hypothetical protein
MFRYDTGEVENQLNSNNNNTNNGNFILTFYVYTIINLTN